MHKLNMGLYVSSGNAVIQSIGTSDSVSGVPSSAQWTIERYSGPTSNLVVKKGGVSNQTLQIQNGSTSINCPAVVSNYSTSANCRWALEKISNPPCGVILYSTLSNIYLNNPTKYVSPNEIITLQALNLVAAAYADNTINQTVTWHSVGSGIASVGYSTGAVTGIVPGTETVFAKKYLKGANRTATYSLNVTELENGIYFIKNKGTSRYVDIEGPTMAAGTTIHQWDFHGGDSQRWIFTHLGNGYYSIKSANSTENYYLGVENDSSAADAPIVLRTGTLTNGMKWRIEVAASGALKILPESGEQYNRVLAVGSYILNFNVNGIDIEQRNYNADTDYIDEWFVTTEINFGFSTDNYTDGCLHGERQSYRYANKFFNKITNQVSQSIFGKVHHYNMDSNRTASKNDYSLNGAFSNNIDFMIYIGHGLTAIDNKGNRLHYNCDFNGNYHTNDHNDEDYNAYSSNMHFGSSESKLRWVWLYTCNFLTTGDHVDDADLKNMMTGAHIVMGYASTAYLCDNMVEAFAFHLRNGEPIISAFFRAGYEGEASATSDHHLQKVLYIPQAINETIYSPCIHYSYNSSDVLTDMHDIQVPYD